MLLNFEFRMYVRRSCQKEKPNQRFECCVKRKIHPNFIQAAGTYFYSFVASSEKCWCAIDICIYFDSEWSPCLGPFPALLSSLYRRTSALALHSGGRVRLTAFSFSPSFKLNKETIFPWQYNELPAISLCVSVCCLWGLANFGGRRYLGSLQDSGHRQ